ncbi:MAG TPA: bifunctional phosphopantothenoylcysteine decarboxylase/phosphopantothenate--cysteine ligase CoaBC [Dermatophilaceae bacterium]|nr:bifunctional phosphopantothenoylcysteine decarboxylase/phosphopantothenate--cysteine ligase CoaBC [Dermatophilaceae bacterium]
MTHPSAHGAGDDTHAGPGDPPGRDEDASSFAALIGARIVLGVSGGIAAYKAVGLLRLLSESGADVTVVPTAAALRFVGEPTWSALSGRPASGDVFDEVHLVRHVQLGQQADLVVVAPATADLLAKAAHGLADDLLTNTLLTTRAPVLYVPAMHTEMWQHPATQANVATLTARGADVMPPVSGRLTGADSGPGRLPEPVDIAAACAAVLAPPHRVTPLPPGPDLPLAGYRLAISAGGTREPLDPVRYLGNRSSGKQGYALAEVAARWGGTVTLISANVSLRVPDGVSVVRVETALELRTAVRDLTAACDVVVMAAAVADFRPKAYAPSKIKKSRLAVGAESAGTDEPHGIGPTDDTMAMPAGRRRRPGAGMTIELEPNPDILAELVVDRGLASAPLLVGFAAETGDETGDVLHHAHQKLAAKGCDLLVANEVGRDLTFGQDVTTVHILARDTNEVVHPEPGSKHHAAEAVWRAVLPWLPARRPQPPDAGPPRPQAPAQVGMPTGTAP